jgi:hypothetical protein
MTVTAYYSTDAHAPSVGGSNQTFWTTILTACLVNGYTGKSAAGWSSAYTGSTGQVAYQQGAGSNGFFLNVDDSAANGNGTAARVTMFETMSAFGTGTNQTPTAAQVSGGLYWPRTNNGTGTNNTRWCVIADAKRFYMWHEGSTVSGTFNDGVIVGFGDIDSYSSSDIYGTMIHGYTAATPSSAGGLGTCSSSLTSAVTGCYIMRRYDQLSTGCQVVKHTDYIKSGISTYPGSGTGALPYPNPVDGGFYFAPIWISEAVVSTTGVLRGVLPGLWFPCNYLGAGTPLVQAFDTVTGTGLLNGKTFTLFNVVPNGNNVWMAFETSNTWS